MDDNTVGVWLPTKEDPEKEKSMRTRGGGWEGWAHGEKCFPWVDVFQN